MAAAAVNGVVYVAIGLPILLYFQTGVPIIVNPSGMAIVLGGSVFVTIRLPSTPIGCGRIDNDGSIPTEWILICRRFGKVKIQNTCIYTTKLRRERRSLHEESSERLPHCCYHLSGMARSLGRPDFPVQQDTFSLCHVIPRQRPSAYKQSAWPQVELAPQRHNSF